MRCSYGLLLRTRYEALRSTNRMDHRKRKFVFCRHCIQSKPNRERTAEQRKLLKRLMAFNPVCADCGAKCTLCRSPLGTWVVVADVSVSQHYANTVPVSSSLLRQSQSSRCSYSAMPPVFSGACTLLTLASRSFLLCSHRIVWDVDQLIWLRTVSVQAKVVLL